MGDAERRRLLYVACTRAIDHLVVSLHRKPESIDRGTAKATSATVLAEAGAAGHGRASLDPPAEALPRSFAEPVTLPWEDPTVWSVERARAIGVASVRSTTSATRLAHDAPADPIAAAAIDPGLAKEGVDLDLPPWQRGRYGTAIGRAVHAVLQDADLATGDDIDGLAAVQCAAEGIFGFEAQVAALSRSALAAPIVRRAAGRRTALARAVRRRRARVDGPRGLRRPARAHRRRAGDRRLQDRPVAGSRSSERPGWRSIGASSPPTASRYGDCSTNRSPEQSSCAAGSTVRPRSSPSSGGTRRSASWSWRWNQRPSDLGPRLWASRRFAESAGWASAAPKRRWRARR